MKKNLSLQLEEMEAVQAPTWQDIAIGIGVGVVIGVGLIAFT
jgi:ElaB/YqjD/DUF883 family membrane-anchored ribosome-binding protein